MSVKVVEAKKYSVKSLERLIGSAVKELGLDLQNRTKRTAVLKPNIVIPAKPSSAIITHPAVVEATISVLEENGFETRNITIAEGSGLGADESRVFEVSGYSELAARKGVNLVNLNSLNSLNNSLNNSLKKAERTELRWKYGVLKIPKIVLDADLYVNLPKMKTHGQTVVTLSMKNQKGLLLNSDKKRFHNLGLHEPLVELAKVVKPDLVVVDGVEGMEGEGPLNGKKKRVGVLVLGTNLLEVDTACCEIMGVKPESVEHIRAGRKQKIGPAKLNLFGVKVKEEKEEGGVKKKFKQANKKYGNILNVYSWRNPYACSMCIDSFSLAVKTGVRSPKYWLRFVPRFSYYALFKRLDVIQGKHAKIPEQHGKVICLGDCTREIAKKNNLTHIKGCPPNPHDILEALSSK